MPRVNDDSRSAAQIAFEERYKRHLEQKASHPKVRERRASVGSMLAKSLTMQNSLVGLDFEEDEDEEPAAKEKQQNNTQPSQLAMSEGQK